MKEAIKLSVALRTAMVEIWPLLTPDTAAASYDLIFRKMRQDGAHLLRDAAAKVHDAGLKVDSRLVEIPVPWSANPSSTMLANTKPS